MYDACQFVHGGAPAHTEGSTKAFLDEKDISLLPWPTCFFYLNCIEHLWAYLDRKFVKTNVTSKDHLAQCLHEEWNKIPSDLCVRLVESMPKRVKACYLAKGGHFKYWIRLK